MIDSKIRMSQNRLDSGVLTTFKNIDDIPDYNDKNVRSKGTNKYYNNNQLLLTRTNKNSNLNTKNKNSFFKSLLSSSSSSTYTSTTTGSNHKTTSSNNDINIATKSSIYIYVLFLL